MTRTKDEAIHVFLDHINDAVHHLYLVFSADTALDKILRPGVADPELLVDCLSLALACEPEEIDQELILPEVDTVDSLITRLLEARRTAR